MLMPSLISCLECGNAFAGPGHFDHHIFAANFFPQAARFRQRALGIAGEIRRHFEADVSIAALGAVVDRTQHVGGILNVADGEHLVAAFGIEIGSRFQRIQQVCVVVTVRDRFFEDRGVRSDSAQPVFVDQALQVAAGDEVAANIVEPYRLAKFLQIFQMVDALCAFYNSSRLHNFSFKTLSAGFSLTTEDRRLVTAIFRWLPGPPRLRAPG